jgi:hypothetical protein
MRTPSAEPERAVPAIHPVAGAAEDGAVRSSRHGKNRKRPRWEAQPVLHLRPRRRTFRLNCDQCQHAAIPPWMASDRSKFAPCPPNGPAPLPQPRESSGGPATVLILNQPLQPMPPSAVFWQRTRCCRRSLRLAAAFTYGYRLENKLRVRYRSSGLPMLMRQFFIGSERGRRRPRLAGRGRIDAPHPWL